MDELERRYRRLMRAYPAGYRREREDEIVATLLDAAPPGRARPSLGDTADIVVAGLRVRIGAIGTGELSLGLRTAAPVALAVAAGTAVIGLLRDSEPTAGHPSPFGLAIFVYLIWLLAVATRIALPALVARALSAVALLGTLAALAVMPSRWNSPSPGWSLVLLMLLGVVAFLGGGERLSARERLRLAGGSALAVSVFGAAALLVPDRSGEDWLGSGWAPLAAYPSPVEAVTAFALALLLAALAIAARRGDRRWRVATLVLLLATGWLLVPGYSGGGERLWRGLVMGLSVAVAIWVLRRTASTPSPASAARIAAVLALGCAAALAATGLLSQASDAYLLCTPAGTDGAFDNCVPMGEWVRLGRPAYLAWLGALLAWALLPRLLGRIAVATAVVATPAVLLPHQWGNLAPDLAEPMALSALGVVTLLCSTGPASRADRAGAVAAAVASFLVPVVLIVPSSGASSLGLVRPWFPMAFLPLVVALAAGWRLASRASGRAAARGIALVAVSAAWIVMVAFQVYASPTVPAVMAAVAGVAVAVVVLQARPKGDLATAPLPDLPRVAM